MHILRKSVKKLLIPGMAALMAGLPAYAQNDAVPGQNDAPVASAKKGIKVKGTVKDAITKQPLQGINITSKAYAAAITDEQGNFTIEVPALEGSLIVSGANFQTKELALKGRATVEVMLYEDSYSSVYDQAMLPNGSEMKSHIPYSVTSVNTGGGWESPVQTPDSYLQGKFAGLDVVRRSGTPDAGANLYLRGYNSLYASTQPLIVVDGVIYDQNNYGTSFVEGFQNNSIANIDLKDIDQITLIKDGSGMYGSRGGNGVLLITTGKAKDIATRLDFAAYGGYNFNPKNLPVMGAADHRLLLSDLLKSQGLTDDQIQAQPYMNDAANPDYYTYHNNTNWQDQVTDGSSSQNYYLKVTGGDDIATYALSLNYLKNKGIVQNTDLARYQTRFNADLNLSKRLKAFTNLSFGRSEQNLNNQAVGSTKAPIYLALTKSPLLSPNEMSETGVASPNLSDTDIFGFSNPAAAVSDAFVAKNDSYRFVGNFGLNYTFSDKFKLNSLVGVTFNKIRENMFVPGTGIAPDTLATAVGVNETQASVQRLFSVYNDTWLNFKHNFDANHKLTANLGFRYHSSKSEFDSGLSYNTASDDFITLNSGQSTLRTVSGNLGRWNWLNTYLNAGYNAYDKYFIDVNLSVDGSSRFGQEISDALKIGNYRYAVLPSVAAAWLISSENFMADNNFIELLKLRASYGLSGNDDIGNYAAKNYYVSQNFLGRQGLVRGNIGNPELQWESNTRFNAGIDASFLKERLSISLDYYNNQIKNMLIYAPVFTASGFDFAVSNSGEMSNQGVELAVSGRLINRADLKWDIGLTLSTNKNEVKALPDGDDLINSYGGATFLTREGEVANLFYGYRTNGVYASDAEAAASGLTNKAEGGAMQPFAGGDVRFVDLNNDNIIDENDREIIGNPNPDWIGSYTNRLNYKRFTLDAQFTFSTGNDIYNGLRQSLESMSGYENQTLNINNRWRANGQVTDVPAATFGDPMMNSRFSDRWIEDGSYLRLRALSLSYDLPIKSSFIRNATIYGTAYNVFTLTKYLGYDPEFNGSSSAFSHGVDIGLNPLYKSMQLGLRIGL